MTSRRGALSVDLLVLFGSATTGRFPCRNAAACSGETHFRDEGQMSSEPVRLVLFSKDTLLRRTLESIGHDILPIEPEIWLSAAEKTAHGTVVLLFDGEAPVDSVARALGREREQVLLLLTGEPALWPAALIERSTDYVAWPCSVVELCWRLRRMKRTLPSIEDSTLIAMMRASGIIGSAPSFLRALELIGRVAVTEIPVLIEGETGSGKEVAARAVHYMSPRRDRPFIPVNCGALPDSLIENELFGHEKGAFTDAHDAQPGLVALAAEGTLFLDEIDALSPKAQVSLLRFLQDRTYKPLGGRTSRRSNVRIISACNTDLKQAVHERRFRQDLLFRLAVMPIRIPPLRERGDDVVLLAEHFVQRNTESHHCESRALHPSLVAALRRQDWPGNVRELENYILRALLLTPAGPVCPPEGIVPSETGWQAGRGVPPERLTCERLADAKARMIAEFERRYLEALLSESAGNVSAAARRAGKERRALGKLLKKYGLALRPDPGTRAPSST
jgi:DNA-binding NtrC family response regulator